MNRNQFTNADLNDFLSELESYRPRKTHRTHHTAAAVTVSHFGNRAPNAKKAATKARKADRKAKAELRYSQ